MNLINSELIIKIIVSFKITLLLLQNFFYIFYILYISNTHRRNDIIIMVNIIITIYIIFLL